MCRTRAPLSPVNDPNPPLCHFPILTMNANGVAGTAGVRTSPAVPLARSAFRTQRTDIGRLVEVV